MTDVAAIAPDAIVETALQLLPVPEHAPGFWAALDARLAAEQLRQPEEAALAVGPTRTTSDVPASASAAARAADARSVGLAAGASVELGPDPAMRFVPSSMLRRSNAVLLAVGFAAVALVVVSGAALVQQRTTDRVGAPDEARAQPATRAEAVVTSSTLPPAVPTKATLDWVAAMGKGDTTRAWALLGPASKAHFGSRSSFEAQGAILAARYAAWSSVTPERVLVTPLASSDSGDMVVVTLVGTIRENGVARRRSEALPVRVVDGSVWLEPYALAGELQVVVPGAAGAGEAPSFVRTDEALVVVVPRGVDAPTIRLDGGDALVCGRAGGTELTELDNAPGQRCTYRPRKGIRPGQRVLTVAFQSSDGSGISAQSVVFEAA